MNCDCSVCCQAYNPPTRAEIKRLARIAVDIAEKEGLCDECLDDLCGAIAAAYRLGRLDREKRERVQ